MGESAARKAQGLRAAGSNDQKISESILIVAAYRRNKMQRKKKPLHPDFHPGQGSLECSMRAVGTYASVHFMERGISPV